MLKKKNEKLCVNLKKLRNERSLTQQNVADGIKIKQTSYGDLENGKSKLYAARLWQLAEFFGVSVGSLCDEESNDPILVKVLQARIEELTASLEQSDMMVAILRQDNEALLTQLRKQTGDEVLP